MNKPNCIIKIRKDNKELVVEPVLKTSASFRRVRVRQILKNYLKKDRESVSIHHCLFLKANCKTEYGVGNLVVTITRTFYHPKAFITGQVLVEYENINDLADSEIIINNTAYNLENLVALIPVIDGADSFSKRIGLNTVDIDFMDLSLLPSKNILAIKYSNTSEYIKYTWDVSK